MKPLVYALLAMALWSVPVAVRAEHCRVQNAGAPGVWKFIRAYDPETGQVVLRQAVNGGDSKSVTVSKNRVRVEWKLAGDKNYHPAALTHCKGGNTVRI